MNTSTLSLKVSLLAFAIMSATSFASEDKNADAVMAAYSEYQLLLKEGTQEQRFAAAKKAYELSQAVHGDLNEQTIALGQNYAKLFNFDHVREAHTLYEKLLQDITSLKGEQAIEKIDILLNLAKLNNQLDKHHSLKDNLAEAIKLAENAKVKGLDAQVYYDAAEILAPTKYRSLMTDYLDAAATIAKDSLPKDSLLDFKITYFKAQLLAAKKKHDEAITLLEDKVATIDAMTQFDSAIEQQMRISLINWYEETGQVEKSTKQCQALGKLVPWSNEQEQIPLFRTHPKLNNVIPSIRNLKDTTVIAKFDVTPEGTVDNIEIESVKGNRELAKLTKDTIKTWRYAPKFEDGKPVTATTQVMMDYKFGN